MRAIHAALPALALAACGMLWAEVEVPSVELTLRQESFPATAAGASLTKDFTYDLGKDIDVITKNDVTVHLKLQSLRIESTTDLQSIQSVSIRVIPPAGSGLPEVALVEYTKPAGSSGAVHAIEAASATQADLGPYLTAGALTLRASASGSLPTVDWLADVTADFWLKVRYPYGKAI